jgi:outer membrane lipopolysaccharide assembly protein LptE/RlpB
MLVECLYALGPDYWTAHFKEDLLKKFLVLVMICAAMTASACGYSFRGKLNNLPSDVLTIQIPVFENRSGEERAETVFTDQVIFEFTRSQILTVVSRGKADSVLKGIIVKSEIRDIALSATETSRQRRITMTVDASLTRTRDGKVLWSGRNIEERRTYSVGATPQATEINKNEAIRELAEDLAQTLHDRVFENF